MRPMSEEEAEYQYKLADDEYAEKGAEMAMIEVKEQKEKAPSLFELTADFESLLSMGYPEITDKDDEETKELKQSSIEAFNDTLSMLLDAIDSKADGYCAVIRRFEGRADIIKQEIDRLTALKKSLERAEERMKEALIYSMQITGRNEIKTDLHTIKLVKNGGQTPLNVDKEHVPDEYKKVIIEKKPDNDKIRKALESGEKLPFASFGERGVHLKGI